MNNWNRTLSGFSGNIKDFPLPSLLQIIELGQRSGFLYLRSYPRVAALIFFDGKIIQAINSMRRAGLGELLIASGVITQQQLEHALGIQKERKSSDVLGNILMELGYVSSDNIVQALSKQIKEIVMNLLAWENGEFSFFSENRGLLEKEATGPEMILPQGIWVQEILAKIIYEDERRSEPRMLLRLRVTFEHQGESFSCYTQDVSAKGMFVLTEKIPDRGQTLQLKLWIPTLNDPVAATAEVVRQQQGNGADIPRGAGLLFSYLDPAALEIFNRLSMCEDIL